MKGARPASGAAGSTGSGRCDAGSWQSASVASESDAGVKAGHRSAIKVRQPGKGYQPTHTTSPRIRIRRLRTSRRYQAAPLGSLLTGLMLPALSAPVFATDSVGLGHRFFNGMVVGTVVGPPELPNGGAWAFTAVRFNPGV